MPSVEQARAWYPQDNPVHGFDHILRVLKMAERLAEAEGADLEIVRAAALLHDASGSLAQDAGRTEHEHLSADFARQVLEEETWPEERILAVQHCIRAHRYRNDDEPQTLEARVLFDADKLDVIGAFGVARTIAYAVEIGEPLYHPPSPQFQQSGERQAGEPHSAYHEYLFKLRNIKARLYTQSARKIAAKRHEFLVNFFEQMQAEAAGED